MKKSEILASLAPLYQKREELDIVIASYEKLLVGEESLAKPLKDILRDATPVAADTDHIRVEAVEAIADIKSLATETNHTVVEKGGKRYDIQEEWIGPRPTVTDAHGNAIKLDIGNNVF